MEHLPYFYLMVSQPGGCSTESQLLLCGFVPALCVGGCAIAHMAWSCLPLHALEGMGAGKGAVHGDLGSLPICATDSRKAS